MTSYRDLVNATDIERLTSIIKTLNTYAKVVHISQGKVNIDDVLNTGLFDFDRAQQAPGWLQEMRGEHVPETEEYGIGSFNYKARRPFHPEKFHNLLHSLDKASITKTLDSCLMSEEDVLRGQLLDNIKRPVSSVVTCSKLPVKKVYHSVYRHYILQCKIFKFHWTKSCVSR